MHFSHFCTNQKCFSDLPTRPQCKKYMVSPVVFLHIITFRLQQRCRKIASRSSARREKYPLLFSKIGTLYSYLQVYGEKQVRYIPTFILVRSICCIYWYSVLGARSTGSMLKITEYSRIIDAVVPTGVPST